VLGSVGIAIALVGRVVVPKSGSTLSIAVVAALLKALSIGGVVLSPMIAIVIEGLLADLVLSLSGRPRRSSFMLAGAVAVAWNAVHMVLVQGIVFGAGIIEMYVIMVRKAATLFHIPPSSVVAVLAALVVVYVVAGTVAGLVAWEAGRSVVARRSLAGLDAPGSD
jgi:ABC-type thiamin/hydroxymethylpyrimidine transport system permease subunit